MPRTTRRGFTIVEFVIVVAILAILAAIVLPRFSRAKASHAADTVRGDLDRLAHAESSYFDAHQSYAASDSLLHFTPSSGVTVKITSATPTTWSASAFSIATPTTCTAIVNGPGATPVVSCTPAPTPSH